MKKSTFHRYSISIFFILTVLLFFGCGEENKRTEPEPEVRDTVSYTYSPLGPILEIQPSVEDSLRDWKAFWDLQEEMELFRSKNAGDLSFITDELIRIEEELLHDSIPEKVKLPAVRSRSLVFKTLAYKLKDQVEHRVPPAEIDSTRLKMLESYNAFRFHIADALREKVYEDFLNRDTARTDSVLPVQ